MANETLTAQIPGIIEDIQAETLIILQDTLGVQEMVRVRDTEGEAGKTVDFPAYGQVTSSDVATVAEGTDHTTNKQITNTATTATVEEKGVMSFISDLDLLSTSRDFVGDVSTLFASGMRAKFEDDIVNLASGFSQTLAGAGVTMTLADWYEAIQNIKAANGNLMEIGAIISSKQYWSGKGLRALLVDGSGAAALSEEFQAKGFVTNPFGMKVAVSNEIDEDVASGGDAAGMIFAKQAIGVHLKGLISIEAERDASRRGFELVGVGRWKAVELVDLWGNYFLSDVS